MSLFKKLQENSLYWRYRFITRRYLELKRRWRELRHPNGRARLRVVPPTPRGMAAFDPYRQSPGRRTAAGASTVRGLAFVGLVGLAWTALAHTPLVGGGFPIVTLQLAMLVAAAALFIRYW
jgi:hypothetical protein